MSTQHRREILRAAGLSALAARFGIFGFAEPGASCSPTRLVSRGPLPSLAGAAEWLNSDPLTAAGLRGNVVLVQFCTYTCINWLRTLPYIRAWADEYRQHGLIVIGVHSPEFRFERISGNVRRAITDLRITYPVAVDSDHRIWRNFDNTYWPALYLVDAQGQVRHQHFGEGEYVASERAIQDLLSEAGATEVGRQNARITAQGIGAAADWSSLESSENYLGYQRTERFASPSGYLAGTQRYVLPERLRLNEWALSGRWTMNQEASSLHEENGKIQLRFHARDVHLVMGPAAATKSVRFRVRIDGQPPRTAHGSDVDADGHGVVSEQRLYQLIRQAAAVTDRVFEIEFLDPAVECYAFTFG